MKKNGRMLNALHPYWRYEYVSVGQQSTKDPFVGLKKADPQKNGIVIKAKYGCVLMNRFPYAPGHLLVLPYRQVARLEHLTDDESRELYDLVLTAKLLLEKVLKTDGINIGINQGEVSGGSVPSHLHWHIVPRWQGDHSFMPIIGNTRILPRSQESIWKAFVKAYKEIS